MDDYSPSSPASVPQMRFGKIDDLGSRVAVGIDAARKFLFSQQHEEGYWCGELEADAIGAFAYVAPDDLAPESVDLLIDDRFVLVYVATCRAQHEISFNVDLQLVGAPKAERDLLWIRTRRNDEVVFQLSLVTVVDEVDTGIDVPVLDLRVGWHVSAPL